MENMEKKQKKKKKWRDVRSALVMTLLMVAMMSTATYAWFSLTSNPVVNGLQMTAASSEGLKISKDDTNWFNAIDMSEQNNIDNVAAVDTFTNMFPATLINKALYTADSAQAAGADAEMAFIPQFLKPHYTGFTVDSTEVIVDKNQLKNYVANCTFYLKNESTESANVGIITVDPASINANNIGVTDGNPNVEGTFVKLVTDGDGEDANAGNDHAAIEAVRIALVIDETTVVVYEPNSGTTLKQSSTYAINGLSDAAVTPDVISSFDTGEITGGSVEKTDQFTSGSLFEIGENDSVQVDMYVWFEGQDDQCVDQIMKDLIEVQLQFTTIQ